MSINREAAEVTSSLAEHIEFDQTATGGAIGNPTEEQEEWGASPNVQAAIDDLWEKSLIPVGTAIWTVSPTNPRTKPTTEQSQSVQLTVSGTVSGPGDLIIAGNTVTITGSDTPTTVATKIANTLSSAQVFEYVTADGSVVSYRYNPSSIFPLTDSPQLGLTLTSKVLAYSGDSGYYGYGFWEFVSTETIGGKTLYCWIRVA